MSVRLIPLGVNGYFPSFGRQTASYLVLTDKHAIILDAGTGLCRLIEPAIQKLLQPYASLKIILSHYHLDHIVGLSYLPGISFQGKIIIYAPSQPLIENNANIILNQILHPPFTLSIEDFPMDVEIVSLTNNLLDLQGIHIQFRKQQHPGGSIGIRIDDYLVYMTDTIVDMDAVNFIYGVNLLLHEVWLTDLEAELNEKERVEHSYYGGVKRLATFSGIRYLMPIHHNIRRSNNDLKNIEIELMSDTFKVIVPIEGAIYNIENL